MAKVVLVDNFDRENIPDQLLKDEITEEEANELADEYNRCHQGSYDWYARAVADDYRLWRGIEELI